MKPYEETNDVMSMENKFDNFLKNFSNSGGNAGTIIERRRWFNKKEQNVSMGGYA